MTRGQRNDLLAPAVEERVAADDERAGMQLDEGAKAASISLPVPAFRISELHPLHTRRLPHVSQ